MPYQFAEKYRDILRFDNFTDYAVPATLALTQNLWMTIARLKVPAGQGLELGYEIYASLDTAVGRIFANFRDSVPADMNGKMRISILDEEDRPQRLLGTWDFGTLRQTTQNLKAPLPEMNAILTEDKKLLIEIMCYDSGKTFSKANSDLQIDVTKYKAIKV